MADYEKVIKGLEWILENDRIGFGTNWDKGEPQADEERAGKYIWDAITLLKECEEQPLKSCSYYAENGKNPCCTYACEGCTWYV